ncbi:phosphatidylglycerophosphatase A [Desulfurobacterium thermolithotrophum DSM 11699]|uniref:Phosphatidylglycerophosphatase A n=1 Tax=Desulfurobacterium thermolithotrophum (strain DSM 11699 / BSA) TaxID=868864 RepID=F0S1H8_DESTD|nr:phosphatidylglycerophosphatase A [Desulfurobacterium thermolithotrophum]ADY73981.1 phosphatidylglycerophosphatase A [Desulfurobacterium thermolithotrophum DSM 11699]
MNRLMEFIATGFYSGKLPKMPGTWGSILAAILLYFLWPTNLKFQLLIIFITFILSVISADYVAKELGNKDPDCVVIDEILGMEIALLGLSADIKTVFLGLILFRVIDIMKPPPIGFFEKLPGGLGITVDDAVAGVITNVILRLIGGLL